MGKLKEFGQRFGHKAENDSALSNIENIPQLNPDLSNEEPFLNLPELISHYKKYYLSGLSECKVYDIQNANTNGRHFSWIRIDKIVYEKDIFFVDSLSMIYSSLHETADSIVLLLQKDRSDVVKLYLGVLDKSQFHNSLSKYLLQRGISGNLPGISFVEESPSLGCTSPLFVSSVSGPASLRGERKGQFNQGIERIVNSTEEIPSYSILLIANNVETEQNRKVCEQIRKVYSSLSPELEISTSTNKSEASTSTETITLTKNQSDSTNNSDGKTDSESTNTSTTKTEGSSDGGSAIVVNASSNKSESKCDGETKTKGTTHTEGSSHTDGSSTSNASANGTTITNGSSEQIKRENKVVKDLLSSMDRLIQKYESSEKTGIWNFAAYFVAETKTTSMTLACIYKGIIAGNNESDESICVNSWNQEQSSAILKYLVLGLHPVFSFGEEILGCYTPVNSDELAINMSLPQKSVPGVLVKEQAVFGRNVISADLNTVPSLPLGQLYHLGKTSKKGLVKLDETLLSSHVFITGSTGSGKSNTVYYLLDKLAESGKRFLVVEPAKGEYKSIFGGREDVSVYGTNPNISECLRLNPFSFPAGIHIEEHIDRLIDIFNACWPMYAAMPAVLKESICRAYRACGWDLISSTSQFGLYPTMRDVIDELNNYINTSEYSPDSKGDYKGALGTRLQSLSNGIIGQVFSGEELSSNELFDNNVIVDLSRVGSVETKSLIMGFLVMKLNEYRLSENVGMNLPLRHITVIEEAHNLLKAAPSSSSVEGNSVAAKSVEMIASAIAEMRTYGESFIIVDQSPSLLDKAVIANTNTKIIMALPNSLDRDIAASSVALEDKQKNEVSRLQTGVGVVYQKGWEEAVLCKVFPFLNPNPYKSPMKQVQDTEKSRLIERLIDGYTGESVYNYELRELVDKSKLLSKTKYQLDKIINDEELSTDTIAKLFVLIIGENAFLTASKAETLSGFNDYLQNYFAKHEESAVSNRISICINMYVKGCSLMNNTPFYDSWLCQTIKNN